VRAQAQATSPEKRSLRRSSLARTLARASYCRGPRRRMSHAPPSFFGKVPPTETEKHRPTSGGIGHAGHAPWPRAGATSSLLSCLLYIRRAHARGRACVLRSHRHVWTLETCDGAGCILLWNHVNRERFDRKGCGDVKQVIELSAIFVAGRRWWLWAREGLEEADVFAGDAPCPGEAIRCASAGCYALQRVRN
jgi:hypothetical protein